MKPFEIAELILSVLAILAALFAVGSAIFQMGAISQRFKESGEKRDDENKRICEEMDARFKTVRTEMDGRFKMVGNQINNVGAKVDGFKAESETGYVELSKDSQRHHHNLSMAIMLSAPSPKEAEVVALLLEKK